MLKFLGIALLLSGTAGIGFGKARELDQRVEELRILRQLIMLLEGEIRCTHRPLPGAADFPGGAVWTSFSVFFGGDRQGAGGP